MTSIFFQVDFFVPVRGVVGGGVGVQLKEEDKGEDRPRQAKQPGRRQTEGAEAAVLSPLATQAGFLWREPSRSTRPFLLGFSALPHSLCQEATPAQLGWPGTEFAPLAVHACNHYQPFTPQQGLALESQNGVALEGAPTGQDLERSN